MSLSSLLLHCHSCPCAEDLFFSVCSPIERSVVFQLRKGCGSRAVPVFYWSLLAQGYATGEEAHTGVADLLPLCAQLWSHPLFPSIFALLFHLWLLGQFSRVGSQQGFQSVQLAALASGCQRLFWSDVQTHSAEFRSIFGFLCGAVSDRERMQCVAPQLHRELAFVVMRFAFYYTNGEPAVHLIKQLPVRGVLASKQEAQAAGIPWEFIAAAADEGYVSDDSDDSDGRREGVHHVTQHSAPPQLRLEAGGTSGILRSGRFPHSHVGSEEYGDMDLHQQHSHAQTQSVPGDLMAVQGSPWGIPHPPSLSSLTAEQADEHPLGLHTPPRPVNPVDGGSPGGHSASTPYMFESDSEGSTPPITPRQRSMHTGPRDNTGAVDAGVLLASHPPLPDFSQPLGGGFSPPLSAPQPAKGHATAESAEAAAALDTQSVPTHLPSTAGDGTPLNPTAAATPPSDRAVPGIRRNPAAQTIASEVRRTVAEEPQLQFNGDTDIRGLQRTLSMAGISQEALQAAAAADEAAAASTTPPPSSDGAPPPIHSGTVGAPGADSPGGALDDGSVLAEPPSSGSLHWGQPRWDVPPGDPRAMEVKTAALVLQACSTVRGIRHEASLVHYLGSMAFFRDDGLSAALGAPSSARLRACLHAFTSPGGPLFPTKRVRAVSRRTLDLVFPAGVTVRRLVALAFRLLSPTYVLESAQHSAWTTTLACAKHMGCTPRQVTSSAVGLLNTLGLPLPAPVTASLQALPRGGSAGFEGGHSDTTVQAVLKSAALQAQACCSRVLCICCCVPTRYTMPVPASSSPPSPIQALCGLNASKSATPSRS